MKKSAARKTKGLPNKSVSLLAEKAKAADNHAESTKRRARQAKRKLKAVRRALKLARKAAKRARKEAARLRMALRAATKRAVPTKTGKPRKNPPARRASPPARRAAKPKSKHRARPSVPAGATEAVLPTAPLAPESPQNPPGETTTGGAPAAAEPKL